MFLLVVYAEDKGKKKKERVEGPLQSNDSNPVGNFSTAIIGERK